MPLVHRGSHNDMLSHVSPTGEGKLWVREQQIVKVDLKCHVQYRGREVRGTN